VSNWLKHPVTAWRNHRDDVALRTLLTAIVLGSHTVVEHEELRGRLGWSARRFDRVTDMAIDIGVIDYKFDEGARYEHGGAAPVLYHMTEDGSWLFLHGRRER
jgi:hypothetical protein